jgi:hypothetical protein
MPKKTRPKTKPQRQKLGPKTVTKRERVLSEHWLLLSFIASLTLCDHMGDVMGDIENVLKRIGYEVPDEDMEGL